MVEVSAEAGNGQGKRSPVFAPGEWTLDRFWVYGTSEEMEPNRIFGNQEAQIRDATRSDFVSEIDLLQRGLALFIDPFVPGTVMAYPDSNDLSKRYYLHAYQFQLMMLGNEIRILKSAGDMALDGHYSSCFALCRVLLESWKKVLFVRRAPNLVYRFIPVAWVDAGTLTSVGKKNFDRRPTKVEWECAIPLRTPQGSVVDADRKLLNAVRREIVYLHNHSHPTLESATQLMVWEGDGLLPNQLSIYPVMSAVHARRCFRLLNIAAYLLLREEREMFHREQAWLEAAKAWADEFAERFHFAGMTASTDKAVEANE